MLTSCSLERLFHMFTCGFDFVLQVGVSLLKLIKNSNTHTSNITVWGGEAVLAVLRGDTGCHDCLTILVLGFTDIVSKVNGLQVLHRHRALRETRGVAHTSVNQPPGCLDVDGPVFLHMKHNM